MWKFIRSLLTALPVLLAVVLFNAVIGAGISALLGLPLWTGAVALNVLALAVGPFVTSRNVARAGVNQEVWTGVVLKKLREALENLGWFAAITNYDEYVDNDTIHFTELGGDPKVLVNNTTYPLNISNVTDKPVSLDNFETEATSISDKELDTISYDKLGSVRERHKEVVEERIYVKALHALAPQSHSDGSPVLLTTGATAPEGGRKQLSLADLRLLKKAFDKWKTPKKDRILVLCPDHVQDLLAVSETFARQYNLDNEDGRVGRLYGFDIYEYTETPAYTVASKTKLAFGAIAGSGTAPASVAYHSKSCMRATGSLTIYESLAKNDPIHHRNLYNVRQRAICAPLRSKECLAAIISANA